MNIHKQLKAIRKACGISQEKLALDAKVTQRQVCRTEGGFDCCLSTIRRMLKAMGYDLAAVPVEQSEGGKNGDENGEHNCH